MNKYPRTRVIVKQITFGIFLITIFNRFNLFIQAQAPTLTRGPYLQSVTANSVLICWETDVVGNSRVEYGQTDSYGMSEIVASPVTVAALFTVRLGVLV